MNKILVIGGSGTIGCGLIKIAQRLAANCRMDNYSIEDADLSTEDGLRSLRRYIHENDYSSVIVLAAQKRENGDNKELCSHNNRITRNICSAISDFDLNVVYISSCAVYGEKNDQSNYDEQSPLYATSYYGEHKIYSERLYQSTISSDRLLIVRPPVIYNDLSRGYDPCGILYSAMTHGCIRLWGDGSEKREFIYVDDAATIILRFSLQGTSGLYNLVSGTSYSFEEIANHIKARLKTDIHQLPRSNPAVNHTYNPAEINKILGEFRYFSPIEVINRNIIENSI